MDEARIKKKCLWFKVDFEKEYDYFSWRFHFHMLHRLGFDETWIKWMYGYLNSSWALVLVESEA